MSKIKHVLLGLGLAGTIFGAASVQPKEPTTTCSTNEATGEVTCTVVENYETPRTAENTGSSYQESTPER